MAGRSDPQPTRDIALAGLRPVPAETGGLISLAGPAVAAVQALHRRGAAVAGRRGRW